jgi:hypothetical protein
MTESVLDEQFAKPKINQQSHHECSNESKQGTLGKG